MAYGISGAAGASSVFNTPGLRPTDSATQQGKPQQAAQPPRAEEEKAQAAAPAQSMNTAPTEQERKDALASGATRGSFVNIQA